MADEWIETSVDEIAAQSPNALVTGPFGSKISSRFFRSSGVPVIRGSNLSDDVTHRLIEADLAFLTTEKASEFARNIARRRDLVFTCWGTIGQVGLVDERASYREYVISNKQMKLTPDPQKADSLFLYYLFSGPEMYGIITGQSIGSSVPGFNLGQLCALRFRLPPLFEQQSIAEILGSLDDKIQLNRRINRTLEAMARAIFKAWFIDFEPVKAKAAGAAGFPGMPQPVFDQLPDQFTETELGPIPAGWELAPLDELFEVNPRRTMKKGDVAPYLAMSDMPTQGHSPDNWGQRGFGSGMRFKNGDTLVARITPCLENGKTAFVDFLSSGEIGWGSTEYIVLSPRPPLPPVYAYCLARSDEFREFAITNMTGTSGRQRVAASSLSHFTAVRPTKEVAIALGASADPMFALAAANQKECRTLAATRDTLLPKLISGELRIPEAGRIVRSAV